MTQTKLGRIASYFSDSPESLREIVRHLRKTIAAGYGGGSATAYLDLLRGHACQMGAGVTEYDLVQAMSIAERWEEAASELDRLEALEIVEGMARGMGQPP